MKDNLEDYQNHQEINFKCVINFYIFFIFRYIFFFHYFIMTHKISTFGSRIQVYRGNAKKTSGGLTKSDLMMNKHGRVVSKAKHFTAKKEMRLLKHGFGTQKGKFGFVKVGKKSRKSKKMKGGMHQLSPGDANWSGDGGISGAGITDFGNSSTDVQLRAGMSGGRRKRRSLAMAGGSGMNPLSSPGAANWSGEGISGAGITDFGAGSDSVQFRAGMSGGRKRRRSLQRSRGRSRGFIMKSRGKALAMQGGTTSQHSQINAGEFPSSIGVQLSAGLGN